MTRTRILVATAVVMALALATVAGIAIDRRTLGLDRRDRETPEMIRRQIVALDVLPADAFDTSALETRIRAACDALPPHARPRLIRFVESIDTANGKLMRRTS